MLDFISNYLKKIKRHAGLSFVTIGNFGSTGLAAIFWFIMAILVDPSDYGLLNYYIALMIIISTICVFGLNKTIITYFPKEKNLELFQDSISLILLIELPLLLLFLCFEMLIFGLLIISHSLFLMLLAIKLGAQKYHHYMLIMIFEKLIQIPCAIFFFSILGLTGIFIGYIIAFSVTGFGALRWFRIPSLSFNQIRRKIHFIVNSFGVDITTISMNYLDKIIIGIFFGMVTLGYYSFAYQIYTALMIIPVSLSNYLLPEKSSGSNTRNVELFGIIISIVGVILIVILSPSLISIFFPRFIESIILTRILSCALIAATFANIFIADLYAKGKANIILRTYLISLSISITFLVILGKLLGAIGLVISIIISQIALVIALAYYSGNLSRQ